MNYKKNIGFAFMVLVAFFSCTKNFDKYNTPHDLLPEEQINATNVGQAFGYAQYYGLNTFYVEVAQTLHADQYAQYFTSVIPNFSTERYVANGVWVNLFWNEFYTKSALMLHLTEQVTSKNMPVENAIAKIYKVMMYHRMTDYFGPIIYSQFANYKKEVSYDSQKDVYYDFFKILDSAEIVLKANAGKNGFGVADQVYKGDADHWLRFANSLRLRLAMRLSYVEPDKAKTEAEKAVTSGPIVSNADNAFLASTLPDSKNILSRITYLRDFRASSGLMSALLGYQDPRISVYYSPADSGGVWAALRNGLPASDRGTALAPFLSFVGPKYINRGNPSSGTDAPNKLINAAEVAFLRAEGALRGWNMGGNAKDFYNQGIRLSLTETVSGISEADIAGYQNSTKTPAALNDKWHSPAMSNIPVVWDDIGNFEKKLEQIITQKWIAVYPDGYEAWAERRRTGYPRGYALIGSDNPEMLPTDLARRVIYPPNELSVNKTGYDEAVGLLGGADKMNTRLWWDKKPLAEYPAPAN